MKSIDNGELSYLVAYPACNPKLLLYPDILHHQPTLHLLICPNGSQVQATQQVKEQEACVLSLTRIKLTPESKQTKKISYLMQMAKFSMCLHDIW